MQGGPALDVATDRPPTLSPKADCYKLITGMYWPSGAVWIILGRNGLTSQRFILHPSIVEGDSNVEI